MDRFDITMFKSITHNKTKVLRVIIILDDWDVCKIYLSLTIINTMGSYLKAYQQGPGDTSFTISYNSIMRCHWPMILTHPSTWIRVKKWTSCNAVQSVTSWGGGGSRKAGLLTEGAQAPCPWLHPLDDESLENATDFEQIWNCMMVTILTLCLVVCPQRSCF